jgi:hypothetical protein
MVQRVNKTPGKPEDWELEDDPLSLQRWSSMCRKMTEIKVYDESTLIVGTYRCLRRECLLCKSDKVADRVKHHILGHLPLWFAAICEANKYQVIEDDCKDMQVDLYALGGPTKWLVLTGKPVLPQSAQFSPEDLLDSINTILSTTSWAQGIPFKVRDSSRSYVGNPDPATMFAHWYRVAESRRDVEAILKEHGYEQQMYEAGVGFLRGTQEKAQEIVRDLIEKGALHEINEPTT